MGTAAAIPLRFQCDFVFVVEGTSSAKPKVLTEWLIRRRAFCESKMAAIHGNQELDIKVKPWHAGSTNFAFVLIGKHVGPANNSAELVDQVRAFFAQRYEYFSRHVSINTPLERAIQIREYIPPV